MWRKIYWRVIYSHIGLQDHFGCDFTIAIQSVAWNSLQQLTAPQLLIFLDQLSQTEGIVLPQQLKLRAGLHLKTRISFFHTLVITCLFWRQSRTKFKTLKFSLQPSAIPGSFMRNAILVYQFSVRSFHTWLSGPILRFPEKLSEESSERNSQRGLRTVGGIAGTPHFQFANLSFLPALSIFFCKTMWKRKGERCFGEE